MNEIQDNDTKREDSKFDRRGLFRIGGLTAASVVAIAACGKSEAGETGRIGAEETTPELEARLADMGAALLLETIDGLAAGTLSPTPQDHAAATIARMLRKEDGRIDWTQRAEVIARRVRGLAPWPGTATVWAGSDLKVLRAAPAPPPPAPAAPGTVISTDHALVVACGECTALRVTEVQPASRRAMAAGAFAAGARLVPGARLG